MLRPLKTGQSSGSFDDIKKDLSLEQLAGIGAVSMAWNKVEFMLHVALYSGESLDYTCLQDDLPRRRLDQKIKDLRSAADIWNLPDSCIDSIKETVRDFSKIKELRNAVIHSRVSDAASGIGLWIAAKGKMQEVLLRADALEWLYRQIVGLCLEIRCILAVFDLARTTDIAVRNGLVLQGQIDPVPEIMDWALQLIQSRQSRYTLGDAPSFTS